MSKTTHFFRMGEIMKEFRDKRLWLDLDYESFEAYYSDPELGFKRSSVYHAIKLLERFPKWDKVADIPLSKLIMISPHVTEENESELLAMARSLSGGDLKHELLSLGLVAQGKEAQTLPKIYGCKDCGKVKGVTFEEFCFCGLEAEKVKQVKEMVMKLYLGGL